MHHSDTSDGYALAAYALGGDLLQQTDVASVAAGNSSVIAQRVGMDLSLASYPLQAMFSEPLKPILNTVIMSNVLVQTQV